MRAAPLPKPLEAKRRRLQSRGVALGERLLEQASRPGAVQDWLVRLAVPRRADDDEWLRGSPPPSGVRVVSRTDSGVTLDWEGPALPAVLETPVPPVLDRDVAQRLFSAEDIARIQLAILTGVEPGPKIEALRRLAFAPIPDADKGLLYLRALSDSDAQVRREAAQLLRTIGLNPDLADALATLATGTPRQKEAALLRLRALSAALSPSERSVALAFLQAALGHETAGPALAGIVEALGDYLDAGVGQPEALRAVVRSVLRALPDEFAAISPVLPAWARRLGQAAGSLGARLLWEELGTLGERRARHLVLGELFGLPLPADLAAPICGLVEREFLEAGIDSMDFRRMIEGFKRLGSPAVQTLLGIRARLSEADLPAWVAITDSFAASEFAGAADRRDVARAFRELLGETPRPVRLAILESRLPRHADLPASEKRALAVEFLRHLHLFPEGWGYDLARAALRALGPAALGPLEERLQTSPYPGERETAAALLGEIAQEGPIDEAERVRLLRLLRGLEGTDRASPGALLRASGRVARSLRERADEVEAFIAHLDRQLGRVGHAVDVLTALCHALASPVADPKGATEIAFRILDTLCGPLPEPKMVREETADGPRHVIGAEAEVYTEVVPQLLDGLEILYVHARLPGAARRRILERILAIWRDVVECRILWAPGSLVRLASFLAALVRAENGRADAREPVLDALEGSMRNLSVLRELTALCGEPGWDDDAYAARMERLSGELFRFLSMAEYREPADRGLLLCALGRIAQSARLGTDARRGEEVRRRIVDRLLEEAAAEARDLRRAMARLAEAKSVPADLRERVRRRLAGGSPRGG